MYGSHTYESYCNSTVLDCCHPPEEDLLPILRVKAETAIHVESLKKGKSAGFSNILAELV